MNYSFTNEIELFLIGSFEKNHRISETNYLLDQSEPMLYRYYLLITLILVT